MTGPYMPEDWLLDEDNLGSYDDNYDYDYGEDVQEYGTGYDYDPEENDWFYSDEDV